MGVFGGHSISLVFVRAREAWGNIVDVAGLGMGCTLINRNVLETLEFRLFDGRADWLADEVSAAGQKTGLDLNPHRRMIEMVHDDWLLALEAKHHGFVQRAHMGVVCGHIETEGTILWPSLSAPSLFYAEAAA
jgi:hypothetical protein